MKLNAVQARRKALVAKYEEYKNTNPAYQALQKRANEEVTANKEATPYDLGKETYQTQLLFSYDGGAQSLYDGRADTFLLAYSAGPKVYKDNVYLPLVAHGRSLRIIKVPLI